MTNAEHIRKMTDYELRDFLFDIAKNGFDYGERICSCCAFDSDEACKNCLLKWLHRDINHMYHGSWETPMNMEDYIRCSRCHSTFLKSVVGTDFKFCPICGAEMQSLK